MRKGDRDYLSKMEGVEYALRMVAEKGYDEALADFKRRRVCRANTKITDKQVKDYYNYLTENIYNNMLGTVLYTLHDTYGFGKERLIKFRGNFDYNIKNVLDLNYMGEHYVSLEDYLAYLNDKYDLGLDTERASYCVDQDRSMSERREVSTQHGKEIAVLLDNNGFSEAAKFLRNKIGL